MQPVRLWAAGLLITCAVLPRLSLAADAAPAKPGSAAPAANKPAPTAVAPKKSAPSSKPGAPAKEAAKAKKPATRNERPAAAPPVAQTRTLPGMRRAYGEVQGDEELRAGADDPELQGLRDAERALFPRP